MSRDVLNTVKIRCYLECRFNTSHRVNCGTCCKSNVYITEQGCADREKPQDNLEAQQNVSQHTHGAEPSEICPECEGSGLHPIQDCGLTRACPRCNGVGKLHNA